MKKKGIKNPREIQIQRASSLKIIVGELPGVVFSKKSKKKENKEEIKNQLDPLMKQRIKTIRNQGKNNKKWKMRMKCQRNNRKSKNLKIKKRIVLLAKVQLKKVFKNKT